MTACAASARAARRRWARVKARPALCTALRLAEHAPRVAAGAAQAGVQGTRLGDETAVGAGAAGGGRPQGAGNCDGAVGAAVDDGAGDAAPM